MCYDNAIYCGRCGDKFEQRFAPCESMESFCRADDYQGEDESPDMCLGIMHRNIFGWLEICNNCVQRSPKRSRNATRNNNRRHKRNLYLKEDPPHVDGDYAKTLLYAGYDSAGVECWNCVDG